MLCKYIIIRSCYRTFKCQSNSSYHRNLQQQTSNNQQIRMYSIQSNPLICNRRCVCSIILPKRVISIIINSLCPYNLARWGWLFCVNTFRKRLPQCQKDTNSNTKKQYPSYWISTTLMGLNFSRWNVLKHNYKQKQNSQSSNINQLLQQNKIFKSLLNQKARTMQKQQNQIKYRMHWIFRLCHLINTHKCTSSYQSKNLTHLNFYIWFCIPLPLLR
jgi:hypothetical protein